LRVISGKYGGRNLVSLPGMTTRPILVRVKESVFNLLRPIIHGKRVLDAFAGSGSIGIEALSIGATHCTFLDTQTEALAVIKKNLVNLNVTEDTKLKNIDAFSFLRLSDDCFDIIFLDPPQFKGLWNKALYAVAEKPSIVSTNGSIIVKFDPSEKQTVSLTDFVLVDERKYGKSMIQHFKKIKTEP
jgi:16S rRNA (guanine966-N2)-methyltransferase